MDKKIYRKYSNKRVNSKKENIPFNLSLEIKDRGVAQSGRASALGVEGQVFESLFPDQSYQYS